jgi:hypothetical protein
MMCLYGTAQITGYSSAPIKTEVELFRVFPTAPGGSTSAPTPLAAQYLALDGTWAFSADQSGKPLDAWDHYYVQVVPQLSATQIKAAATRVGPLALPGSGGAPIAIQVKPVQLEVLEEKAAMKPMYLQWASAHLFDPASGNDVQAGATVSILVGATPTPMPWVSSGNGAPAYFHEFQSNTIPAQATYQITSSLQGSPAQATWTLTADPPTSDVALTSPVAGTPLHAGQALTVTWPPHANADFELVQLYVQEDAGFPLTYASPQIDRGDTSSETIPASYLSTPGTYLLNVAFIKANCPASGDGCVQAGTVADMLLAVQ